MAIKAVVSGFKFLCTGGHLQKSRLVRIYAPLSLLPGASQALSVGLICIFTLAIAAVMVLAISELIRCILVCITLFTGWLELRLHVLRDVPWAITEAVWGVDGKWRVHLLSGTVCEAQLVYDSFVTTTIVILNFRLQYPDGYAIWYSWLARSLVLTVDSCNVETLRHLRVRLRLERYKSTLTDAVNQPSTPPRPSP